MSEDLERRPEKRQRIGLKPFRLRLFNQKCCMNLQDGDHVYCKRRGVQGTLKRNDNNQWKLVSDLNEERAKLKTLLPVFETTTSMLILITSDTLHFRNLAASQVNKQDSILEIGFSTGETSRMLWNKGCSWVGFDTSKEMIEETQQRLPKDAENVLCVRVDALKDRARAVESAYRFGAPSVVFIDIGGNREYDGVIRMLQFVFECFEPRLIVIKSQEIYQNLRGKVDSNGMHLESIMWFESEQERIGRPEIPKHALQAPLRMSPLDVSQPICRYFNYHKAGCQKGTQCPFDHKHCHICLEPGHRAIDCPNGEFEGLKTR